MLHRPLLIVALVALALPAAAQQVNPAHQAADSAAKNPELQGFDQVPVTVVNPEQLFDSDPVGSYGQPRWTAERLFPTTRVYVRPEGSLQFEYWTRVKVPREGETTVETQYELEFGLPHRFQLDLYFVTEKTGSEGELDTSEQKYELRYALADWGKLWMNPTLYFEYVSRDENVDKIETKLLLGDDLGDQWHFGSNLVYEHELGGEGENEYELTVGVARTITDQKLSLGAEMKAALIDTHSDRGDYDKELEIGPSMRWYPVPQMHVDFAPLIGIGPDSRQYDIFLVLGWSF